MFYLIACNDNAWGWRFSWDFFVQEEGPKISLAAKLGKFPDSEPEDEGNLVQILKNLIFIKSCCL